MTSLEHLLMTGMKMTLNGDISLGPLRICGLWSTGSLEPYYILALACSSWPSRLQNNLRNQTRKLRGIGSEKRRSSHLWLSLLAVWGLRRTFMFDQCGTAQSALP